jgi:threonine/homoserine/homoserine lactone efflux protein
MIWLQKGMFWPDTIGDAQCMPPDSVLYSGAILGFSIAAPVGPIGLLCIDQSLRRGRRAGFVCGLGAAAADFLYGILAAFGAGSFLYALQSYEAPLRWTGALFLLWIAISLLRPTSPQVAPTGGFLTTFALTLSNPLTILSFVAALSAVGVRNLQGTVQAISFVIGVFLGSAAWWLMLSTIAGSLRIDEAKRLWINRASAFVIACFALKALLAN